MTDRGVRFILSRTCTSHNKNILFIVAIVVASAQLYSKNASVRLFIDIDEIAKARSGTLPC